VSFNTQPTKTQPEPNQTHSQPTCFAANIEWLVATPAGSGCSTPDSNHLCLSTPNPPKPNQNPTKNQSKPTCFAADIE
jgi:hypothetical protein